jgi:hypothetical protein
MRSFVTIIFKFKYSVMKIQEDRNGLELNGAYHLVVYDDYDN